MIKSPVGDESSLVSLSGFFHTELIICLKVTLHYPFYMALRFTILLNFIKILGPPCRVPHLKLVDLLRSCLRLRI